MELNRYFKNKKILITGNTGFKGSWLSLFLQQFGAEIFGLVNTKKTSSIFLLPDENQFYADISDFDNISKIVNEIKPDYIFHLAANSIVSNAYNHPLETFQTNVFGSINILESLRISDFKCNIIVATSNKFYGNKESISDNGENMELVDSDPYRASKSMVEVAINSYYTTYYKKSAQVNVAICRSGNVFGGGDWGEDRIIPDCIRSWSQKETIIIKNPWATRPWNYVLDTIYGYVLTAYHLEKNDINGEIFNFGPNTHDIINVKKLVESLWENWNSKDFEPYIFSENSTNKVEQNKFSLYSDKALSLLQWEPKTSINDAISKTVDWYSLKNKKNDMIKYSKQLVIDYINSLEQSLKE
jgi:CDP-glucose 4,6-dehydratase